MINNGNHGKHKGKKHNFTKAESDLNEVKIEKL